MSVHIISWNVNGVRACSTKGLFDFMKKQKPDLLCIQETKAREEQASEIKRPNFVIDENWHPAERPGYSGVANFANKKFKTTLGMGDMKFDQEGRVLVTDLGKAYLLNMYFPNGAMNDGRHFYKMDFLDKILKFFKKLDKEKPLILTGDFNIAHKAVDIHDPVRLDGTSGFKPEERAWMDKLVKAGFTDVYRHLNPDAKDHYTWWSYRMGARKRNKGWRIDYFFVSDRIINKVEDMKQHEDTLGSDHCPLALKIAI
jgi:exodeoxyribonuclease-3